MSRRSRRSIEMPLLKPFISASLVDPSALSPVAFSDIDMENEKISVYNFSDDAVSLAGYRICDFNQYHWFCFPSTFVLPSRTTVSVYCSPGVSMDRHPVEPFLQWTNKDGSLRSAHVLNDDKETVYLYNSSGLCVSTCSRTQDEKPMITRHSHLSNASRNFMSKCKLFLSYTRLLSLLYGGWCSFSDAGEFILWFLFAHSCDFLGRCIWLGDSDISDRDLAIDPLLDAMNTTADRLSAILIVVNILLSIPPDANMVVPSSFPIAPPMAFTWMMRLVFTREHFFFVLVLDSMSHWMRKNAEMYYASSLSSVTEAFKTPLHHLSEVAEVNGLPTGHSTNAKRRSSRGKRRSAGHEDLAHHAESLSGEPDSVHVDPCPDTDELDLIDILRVRLPVLLSAVTVGHEIMLVVAFSSIMALSELRFRNALSEVWAYIPFGRTVFLLLIISMVLKQVLLFTQFLTSTSRVSFEVLSMKTRRQVIPRMH